METIEEIEQLEKSGFGRPRPRHGLKLLYWFAKECLSFNQNNVMQSCCYPENEDFGFHEFKNRYEKNVGKLLPDVAFPYYEVGNLGKTEAYKLPQYVREDYTRLRDRSNMDRIIVSLKSTCFHSVYVTEHSDESNFNKDFTYHISKRLIRIIQGLSLEDFLLRTGYSKQETSNLPKSPVKLKHKASTTTSICSPAITSSLIRGIHKDTESSSGLMKNYTQGHHKDPPTTSISSPADNSSSIHWIQKEIQSSPSLVINNKQGHHEAPPTTTSICSPETTSSLVQGIQKEIQSSQSLMKNTHRHHEAPPATSFSSPVTTSATNQDLHIEIESHSNLFAKNQNTQPECLASQTNFFFWVVYFIFISLFFTFLWGNVVRICIVVTFVSSLLSGLNWNRGAQEQTKEKEGKKSEA